MNAQKEYFIYLLSCFLSGTRPKGQDTDFEALYQLADIHDVSAIIAQELKDAEGDYRPQGKVASHFTQTIGLTIIDYQKREQVYTLMKDLLTEQGIDHLFVKGAVLSRYYPVPEFRTSGDIDIIVDPSVFPQLLSIAGEKGLKLTDNTSSTLIFHTMGIDIELHGDADVGVAYFDDIFAHCENKEGHTLYLSDEEHLLYVICHLAKHIAYRGAGIRMLMDIDVMVRHMAPFDEDGFLALCEKAGIRKTAEGLLSLAAYWLKTPVKQRVSFEDNALLDSFERVMLDGGSFGFEVSSVPARYYDENGDSSSALGKLRVLLRMAFPSREYLKLCYPYYANNRFLYPVARLHRLLDGLFRKKKQAKNAISQVKNESGAVLSQQSIIRELDITFEKRR